MILLMFEGLVTGTRPKLHVPFHGLIKSFHWLSLDLGSMTGLIPLFGWFIVET